MLISIFGTPSALTTWVVNLATILTRTCMSNFNYISEVTLEGLEREWALRSAPAVIFHSDCPQKPLVDIFNRINVPMFLILEEPVNVMQFVQKTRNLSYTASARFTAQSYCTLNGLIRRDNVYVFTEHDFDRTVIDFLSLITNAIGLVISNSEINEIIRQVSRDQNMRLTVRESVAHYFSDLYRSQEQGLFDHEAFNEMRFVADQYRMLVYGETPSQFVWPSKLLYSLDKPVREIDGPIYLLGPSRLLIGGHAMHLPQGTWSATVRLNIFDNTSGNSIISDVLVQERQEDIIIANLPESGAVKYELRFKNFDPFFPIQLRLGITNGAIEGIIELETVTFQAI